LRSGRGLGRFAKQIFIVFAFRPINRGRFNDGRGRWKQRVRHVKPKVDVVQAGIFLVEVHSVEVHPVVVDILVADGVVVADFVVVIFAAAILVIVFFFIIVVNLVIDIIAATTRLLVKIFLDKPKGLESSGIVIL
jgi:hypothetical protein